MASWEYNCPKFANLAACMDESISELEKYFEVDHEDEARNRRTTRRAAAATAASGGTRDPKVEQPVQKPPSTPKTKAGCRLTRQKEQKVVDTCREAPVLSDATAEPPEPARESLTICEITGKGNRNMDKSEERSNSASTSAVKSCKRKTSTKKRILARHPVIPSLNGNDVAMKMEEPPSKVSKPNALPAAKKSGAPLDAKKHVVLPPVRQHARSSARSKSTVAVPAKKVVTPALQKPPAERLQSLAELVVNFHNKTPTRFRRVPKDPGGEQHGVAFKKPTIPVTPKLATLMRSRSASLRDQKRKAEEVNVCVSNSKKSKVEAVRAKAKVAPGSRPALRPKNVEQDLMVSKLSTKPPQKKLAKTPALRDVSKRLTVAMSPAFALKLRSETWKKRKEAEQKANGPTGSSAVSSTLKMSV
nr:uncharacterized protein LOC119179570 [Rhipicephalus microplus]